MSLFNQRVSTSRLVPLLLEADQNARPCRFRSRLSSLPELEGVTGGDDDEPPALVGSQGEEPDEKDVEILIAQTSVSREKAVAALKESKGDLISGEFFPFLSSDPTPFRRWDNRVRASRRSKEKEVTEQGLTIRVLPLFSCVFLCLGFGWVYSYHGRHLCLSFFQALVVSQ